MLHSMQAVMGTAYTMWSPDDGFDACWRSPAPASPGPATEFDN